jgi:alpha-tubulin suppressor-like RCC1 family protein
VLVQSGSIGSHSCAIDESGYLYSWGVGFATGLGDPKPVLTPRLVDTFLRTAVYTNNTTQAAGAGAEEEDDNDAASSSVHMAAKCASIACGGGFTVCVLRNGKVFSWGMWAHGRLGQGSTPILSARYSRRQRTGAAFANTVESDAAARASNQSTVGQKKVARYQLRPGVVPISGYGSNDVNGKRTQAKAVSASCGESHCLCLLSNGDVLVWGQNSCGQLGSGASSSGYLVDLDRPAAVIPFAGNTGTNRHTHSHTHSDTHSGTHTDTHAHAHTHYPIRATRVCAGSFHSVVVDEEGCVWSWGARGSACLGHYDAALVGEWNQRVTKLFVSATGQSKV